MITGLHGYVLEHQLAAPVDLAGATVGLSAELLAGLSSAEIMARLGGSAELKDQAGAKGALGSKGASGAKGAARARPPRGPSYVVVFDGPARTTASKLDDGLQRRRIVSALLEAHIFFVVAPALAAAQLALLWKNKFVSHVAGADETLLWEDAPLILDVFAPHPLVIWRSSLLASLRIDALSFIEIALGAGNNAVIQAMFPLLERTGNPLEAMVRGALQLGGPPPPAPVGSESAAKTGGETGGDGEGGSRAFFGSSAISVYRAAQQIGDPAYLSELQKALTYVARQPVLSPDGTLELHNKTGQDIPKDLTEVIGCQLAPEVYWYLQRGVLGPELLRGVLWGTFSDSSRAPQSPPELSESYKRLQRSLAPLRQQAYSLLTAPMHRYFQAKEVMNCMPGGSTFVRTAIVEPELSAFASDSAAGCASHIMADIVQHVQKLVKVQDVAASELPEALASRAATSSASPPAFLTHAAALALRELAESTLYWLMATGKIPRSIDTASLVRNMPWA